MYIYAHAMSAGDTIVMIRNTSVLPHSCPLHSLGSVNSIGLITTHIKTLFSQMSLSRFNYDLDLVVIVK